jgi:hypothetical protein
MLKSQVLVIRRPGVGLSVRARRSWFDGDGQNPPPADRGGQGAAGGGQPAGLEALAPTELIAMIRELREENAARRVALKQQADAQASRDAAALVEQGKYKELYENAVKERDALKPHEERAQALEAKIRATNEARIKRIPEAMRSVIPADYTPDKLSEWLDANEALLTKPSSSPLDGGKGGDGGGQPPVKLEGLDRELAAAAGLTDADYVKFKSMRSQPPALNPPK